ncbi:MAG: phosphoribosyl-ATP pyrophosphohydrolase/phosphoribosyl-AMP cyclohydrolase, partial [Rhodothermales bacterium]
SRSRGRLWTKGESSGNHLDFVSAKVDCDGDALLIQALPHGPTCHTGSDTCWGGEPILPGAGFLTKLARIIDERARADAATSYTRRLLDEGPKGPGQKVGEEAVETVIAALVETDSDLIGEASDLVFHLMVLLKSRGLTLDHVGDRLRARHEGS